MNILVTAGNTQVPIDQVRCLTNIFSGRTGAALALEAYRRAHSVTLLTSHPGAVDEMQGDSHLEERRWRLHVYRTFDELRDLMERHIRQGGLDAVVHSAAVSDYLAAGVFAPAEGTRFDPESATWRAAGAPTLRDRAAGKIKSAEPELWLRLMRAPKLVDLVRAEWGFTGRLVKFKLEVGMSDEDLLATAESSRLHSRADLMVANTLEGMWSWAYIGPGAGGYMKIQRSELPASVLDALEALTRHG